MKNTAIKTSVSYKFRQKKQFRIKNQQTNPQQNIIRQHYYLTKH